MRVEFLIILAIVGVVATAGFLQGVAVGVAATIVLFVVSYSRVEVAWHVLSGAAYRSQVTRGPEERRLLDACGESMYVVRLQGFIFFGTANQLFEKIRTRTCQCDVAGANAAGARFAIIDFERVTGLDSTAALGFAKILQFLQSAGWVLVLTGLAGHMRTQLTRDDFMPEEGILQVFADLDHGLEWCEDQLIAAATRQLGGRQPSEGLTLKDQLLGVLPDETNVARLMAYMERQDVQAGYCLIRQGDPADALYFVETGRVTAQLERAGQAPVRLQTMAGQNVVGEVGLYQGTVRTASVVADGPSTLYRLTRAQLQRMHDQDPALAAALHAYVARLMAQRVAHLTRTVDALRA
jgi:SulP family sulfate permease